MLEAIVVIVALVLVLVAAVLAWAATRPDTFRVQRTIGIKAPPEKIFPLIDDLRSFAIWSPYEKKDPAMKRAYSGAGSGKGAVYEWDGDRNVGRGRIEIADTSPPSKIALKLDMIKPFESHNIVEFTLEPAGETTNVTWAMHGRNIFFGKVLGIFINMDDMIGRDFEAGLADLKSLAEK